MVPLTGIEPVRCCHRGILSPLRLPIPPQRPVARVILPYFRPERQGPVPEISPRTGLSNVDKGGRPSL